MEDNDELRNGGQWGQRFTRDPKIRVRVRVVQQGLGIRVRVRLSIRVGVRLSGFSFVVDCTVMMASNLSTCMTSCYTIHCS